MSVRYLGTLTLAVGLLLLLVPNPAWSQDESTEVFRFRVLNDNLIEPSVMESIAIVDVYRVGFLDAQVYNVLLGPEILGFSVTERQRIKLRDHPQLILPEFNDWTHSAEKVRFPEIFDVYDESRVRMLYFLQEDIERSSRRFGSSVETVKPPAGWHEREPADRLSPMITLGTQRFAYVGIPRDEYHPPSINKYKMMYIVQEALAKEVEPRYKHLESYHSVIGKKIDTIRTSTRRYTWPENLHNWISFSELVSKSIDMRNRFEYSRKFEPAKRLRFLRQRVRDEDVYSNYALYDLRKIGGPTVLAELMRYLPRAKYFSDDIWESAVRVAYPTIAERQQALNDFTTFVELAERQTAANCVLDTEVEGNPLYERASIIRDLRIGLVETEKLLPLLFRLYDVELSCFLKEQNVSRESLVPKLTMESYKRALLQPRHSGLTVDEIGLLGVVNPYSPVGVRDKQKMLEAFSPPLTYTTLETMVRVPSTLRELIDYCGYGIENYGSVAFPNKLEGTHFVWQFSCDLLLDYDFLGRGCTTEDRKFHEESAQYVGTTVNAVVKSIQNDDKILLTNSFNVLTQLPASEVAPLMAWIFERTRDLYQTRMRRHFVSLLPRVPYFSVAKAIIDEMRVIAGKHYTDLELVLLKMTRIPKKPGVIRDWFGTISELQKNRQEAGEHWSGGEELGVFSTDAVRDEIFRPACDEVDIGWNKRWKKEVLPPEVEITPLPPEEQPEESAESIMSEARKAAIGVLD